MSRIFFDTNLFVYLFETEDARSEQVLGILERMETRADRLCTSALTVGELLVRPIQFDDQDRRRQYEAFFRSEAVEVVPFGIDAAARFAEIRQDRGIKPPDAIQLACASSARCDLFLTNDAALRHKVVPGVPFITGLDRVPF